MTGNLAGFGMISAEITEIHAGSRIIFAVTFAEISAMTSSMS
jgi:hypothetical protein